MATNVPITAIPDSKFDPSDLELLNYLQNKCEKGENNSITEMDVFEDEPWRLPHVDPHPLFKFREWFYFVPRSLQEPARRKMKERLVQGRNGQGTWRVLEVTQQVSDDPLIGYKQDFKYHKTSKTNTYGMPMFWYITEYYFRDLQYQWVLCRIQYRARPQFVNGEWQYISFRE